MSERGTSETTLRRRWLVNLTRLFHVLVLGGSVIGCEKEGRSRALAAEDASNDSGNADADADADADTPDVAEQDAGSADAASQPADAAVLDAASDQGGVRLNPCSCSTQSCCHRPEGGAPWVEEGFECCWGTTCP
jgi:hypothetical protein